MIEQTLNLSNIFLYSEFNLGDIYSEVNFCGKNVCSNFYLRELLSSCGSLENRKN